MFPGLLLLTRITPIEAHDPAAGSTPEEPTPVRDTTGGNKLYPDSLSSTSHLAFVFTEF